MQTCAGKLAENEIHIVSGEGERGLAERYTGERTEQALTAHLAAERCHGDRCSFLALQCLPPVELSFIPTSARAVALCLFRFRPCGSPTLPRRSSRPEPDAN